MERILAIKIEKEEHVEPVMEKIEKEYTKHRWFTGEIPTNFIPCYASCIVLYDNYSITYSDEKYIKAKEIVLSSEFLKEVEKESDNVNNPAHYQGKNECIDVMVALFGTEAVKSFCRCNSFKYRFRSSKKNGEEDIRKAEWYESKLISLESKENK